MEVGEMDERDLGVLNWVIKLPCPVIMKYSAVDSQSGPVIRYHQEVFVHGLTKARSVQLRRDDSGHLS